MSHYTGGEGWTPSVLGRHQTPPLYLCPLNGHLKHTSLTCMLTSLYHVSKFVEIIVISCILSPANWKQCVQVHTWFPPYIQDLKDFQTNPPYSQEKNAVQLRKEYDRLQRNLPSQ
jgi:hypothetical protein